jgi:hypothetical protein
MAAEAPVHMKVSGEVMMKRVDLGKTPSKSKKRKTHRCAVCGGVAVEIRSKRSRLKIVNDERKWIEDKRWTHRAYVCLDKCGLLLSETDRQAEFDFDKGP